MSVRSKSRKHNKLSLSELSKGPLRKFGTPGPGIMFDHYKTCNRNERNFVEFAESVGAECHRNGWPDFIVRGNLGRIFAVEVKGFREALSPDQIVCARILENFGVELFVWNSDAFENWDGWKDKDYRLTPWRYYAGLGDLYDWEGMAMPSPF